MFYVSIKINSWYYKKTACVNLGFKIGRNLSRSYFATNHVSLKLFSPNDNLTIFKDACKTQNDDVGFMLFSEGFRTSVGGSKLSFRDKISQFVNETEIFFLLSDESTVA